MSDQPLEEFENLIDQLAPAARNDLLDYSVFLVWKQTKLVPWFLWRSVLRGGCLWVDWEIKKCVRAACVRAGLKTF